MWRRSRRARRAESVAIRYVAQLAEDVEVLDEAKLARLSSFHIWTDNFAVERLKWKKKQPLHVLLLRISASPNRLTFRCVPIIWDANPRFAFPTISAAGDGTGAVRCGL